MIKYKDRGTILNFEYKITDKIEKLHLERAGVKQVANKLGFYSQFEINEVKRVLEKMCKDGKLEVSNKKYSSISAMSKLTGELRGNKRGFAFLAREDGGEDLFIPHSGLHGAQHGDTVAVEIVKGDEAKVVNIIERKYTRLVGSYQKSKSFGFVTADDNSYFTDIFIPSGKDMNAAGNTKVIVEIEKFGERSPEGRIVEIIGNIGDKQSEVLSILKSYGFNNVFPAEVEAEANQKQYKSTGNRKSFIDMPTISIDGDDSKDLDDAISIFKLNDHYKLYVHIADVSHYVERGSVLDKEAFSRATSVYFPGSVYPMLPPILSNGLCSLNGGVDRLTLTCEMLIDGNGKVIEKRLHKSIINNTHAMTYKNVTKMLNGDEVMCQRYADVLPMIKDAYNLAMILKDKRNKRGNINFETTECKVLLDENGNVADIVKYDYSVSNEIIEEFMICANESVAELMFETELPFVYRVHEIPDPEKISEFRKFVEGCGYTLPKGKLTPMDFQKLLKDVEGSGVQTIISKVMLRCMRKAKYTVDNLGHFGLASDYYCHFTSPIRRYPDLQIHRVIKGKLDGNLGSIPKLASWCVEVSEVSSERERASEMAERDIDEYYKTEYMQKHIGEEFEGIVSGVTSFGVFVELANTCEGLARIDCLPEDNYNFVENRYQLKGTKYSYSLGEKVKIRVLSCDIDSRRVAFRVLEE